MGAICGKTESDPPKNQSGQTPPSKQAPPPTNAPAENQSNAIPEQKLEEKPIAMEDAPKEDKGNYVPPDIHSEEDDDEEEGDNVPDLEANLKAQKIKDSGARISVSAEVYGRNNISLL